MILSRQAQLPKCPNFGAQSAEDALKVENFLDPRIAATCGLTDNWLLQACAEILGGAVDPNDQTDWSVLRDGKLRWFSTSAGAIQVESICSLIEQIVFFEQLYVMEGWTAAWAGSKQLEMLFEQKILATFDPKEKQAEECGRYYIDSLCTSKAVAREHKVAERAWANGKKHYSGQLIRGSVGYLAQSTLKGFSYAPHPIRAQFLKSTLYADPPPGDPHITLKKLVDGTRAKIISRVGEQSSITTLSCHLPSIALLCLQESSSTAPIKTALQLRNEFRQLRESMNEVKMAMHLDAEVGTAKLMKLTKEFSNAIREVERKLGVRELDERDGIAQIAVYKGLGFKVPDRLRAPVIPPRHTTAIHRLAVTAISNIPRILRSSLGIQSPHIVKDLLEFSQDRGKPVIP